MTYTLSAAPIAHMNPLDVHAIYKLRVDVFVHEQQCPYAEIDDTDALDSTVHILAIDDETQQLAGTARVFPSRVEGESVAQFGRFVLAKSARGNGLGNQIMEAALEYAAAAFTAQPVYLEAQAPLVDYYSAYGFEVCGELFDDEGVPHQPMILRRNPRRD